MTTERTTIPLTKKTRDRLKDRGKKEEPYEEIVRKLLDATAKDYAEERRKKEEEVTKK